LYGVEIFKGAWRIDIKSLSWVLFNGWETPLGGLWAPGEFCWRIFWAHFLTLFPAGAMKGRYNMDIGDFYCPSEFGLIKRILGAIFGELFGRKGLVVHFNGARDL